MTDRKQYVSVDNHKANLSTIRCGVPQGSILGPLLFLVYINDICETSNKLELIYDTSVFLSGDNIDTLTSEFNAELTKISSWLISNKIVLNTNKTSYMIFSNRSIDYDSVVVTLDDKTIHRSNSLKFLGVTIDCKLSWNDHIDVICTKISRNIGILNKLRYFPQNIGILNKLRYFPQNILLMLYNAIIQPYFQYCNIAWGSSSNSTMLRLLRLQKRPVRTISHASYLAHTKPLFRNLKILNVFEFSDFNLAIFMYLCYNGFIPTSISDKFCLNPDVHTHNTRGSSNFHLPKIRTCVSQNSVFF